jgi:hypothetical protein
VQQIVWVVPQVKPRLLGYGLDGRGSILGRVKFFSLLHTVQTGSGAHIAFCEMGIVGSFHGVKAARA